MKNSIFILLVSILSNAVFGQISGNVNYQNQVHYSDSNFDVYFPNSNDFELSVKGLANVKADTYVAIFSVTQVGKTAKEVNELINERINSGINSIKSLIGVETYVDMISFVPMYEYETEKKIFSKKTYNEVPAGFELKKNIHIKYSNPNALNTIITAFSKAEIYDLVKVDYFSNKIDATKKALMQKAKSILKEKLQNYESIVSYEFDSLKKQIVDGYKVVLPVEMYKSYKAYNSSSLNLKKSANVNQTSKSKTLYYQAIVDKAFDFVINPTVLEPVIQIMYQVKLKVKEKSEKSNKEYILITPNGDLKTIDIDK